MNNLLYNLISKQRQEISSLLSNSLIPRQCAVELLKNLEFDQIKVITGPRRAGKSTLALQVLKGKKFAYLNFEDEDFQTEFKGEDIIAVFENLYPGYEYILFDEIQCFPNWEKFLNRLQRTGKNIIVTGSNSKLLSSELASALTGRHLSFELLPFSYQEYLLAVNQSLGFESFASYLKAGGFPAVAMNRVVPHDFLRNLWDSIILKDLVQRYRIRRSPELKNLLYLVLNQLSCKSSIRALERGINKQLNHSTIKKFLDYAESAYICCLLPNYSFKPRQRVNAEKKIYLFDNGFYTAQQSSITADHGKLAENYYFLELCRRGLKPGIDFFYYRTKSGFEVDFYIAKHTQQSALCQVCFSVQDMATLNRETRALLEAGRELQITNLQILTMDSYARNLDIDGQEIKIIPIWGQ